MIIRNGGSGFPELTGNIRKGRAVTWRAAGSFPSSMLPMKMQRLIASGPANDCRRRPSGNLHRVVAPNNNDTRGEMTSNTTECSWQIHFREVFQTRILPTTDLKDWHR